MMELTKDFRPARVIVDREGLGVDPLRAERLYGIEPDVVFLRDDNWSLGAPKRYELVAYQMWRKHWTHFARHPFKKGWVPIEKYSGR